MVWHPRSRSRRSISPFSRPAAFFAQLGLNAQEVAAIDKGQPVARVLSWGGPSEVYVFGAVYVRGSSDTYLKEARAIGQLAGTPGYLGVGEIAPNATAADLSALTLEPDDIKALKNSGRLMRCPVADVGDADVSGGGELVTA